VGLARKALAPLQNWVIKVRFEGGLTPIGVWFNPIGVWFTPIGVWFTPIGVWFPVIRKLHKHLCPVGIEKQGLPHSRVVGIH
jgi:hypothetical protein